MGNISPFSIHLGTDEEAVLTYRARGCKTPHRDVLRSRIILAAARGHPNAPIAAALGVHVHTVRKWRKRFAAEGMSGLNDLRRPGRSRVFTPVQVAGVKALACTPAENHDLPLSRLSTGEIRNLAVAKHVVHSISLATVWRWLDEDAIKPWQHHSWIFTRDLDLYARTWNGNPLGPDDYAISSDEKSQLQARHRRHRSLPPGPGRAGRLQFEYRRGGTPAYFAAYYVHRPRRSEASRRAPALHRHCTVHGAGGAGNGRRTVCLGTPGFLGCGQRFFAQRAPVRGPDGRGMAERDPGAPAGARHLVEPAGDLLFRRPTQGHRRRRLSRP